MRELSLNYSRRRFGCLIGFRLFLRLLSEELPCPGQFQPATSLTAPMLRVGGILQSIYRSRFF